MIAQAGKPAPIMTKQAMHEHELDILQPKTYFDNYKAYGSTVMLSNTVKLIPKTETVVGGQIFLSSVSLSDNLSCIYSRS